MATPSNATWPLLPHTRAKHEILRRYLDAWFPILGSGHSRIVYLDGFCGPGIYDGGEPGSPVIALESALKHTNRLEGTEIVFWFLDKEAKRIAQLDAQLAKIDKPQNFNTYVQRGEFEHEFRRLLDDLTSRNAQLAPTFAFIDPFGFKDVPFDLVSRLLTYRSCEALIYFPVDSINRWLEYDNTKVLQHIKDLLGIDDPQAIISLSGDRVQSLRMLYQQQLSTVARFVRYFEMRNNVDRPIYYLFFASNHALGHKKMKEAFWTVDAAGGYRFSDATNPDQLLLFADDPVPDLIDSLHLHFAGMTVEVSTILNWVNNETPYIEKHAKDALRRMEDTQVIRVEPVKIDGKKRVRGFPDGVVVQFCA